MKNPHLYEGYSMYNWNFFEKDKKNFVKKFLVINAISILFVFGLWRKLF